MEPVDKIMDASRMWDDNCIFSIALVHLNVLFAVFSCTMLFFVLAEASDVCDDVDGIGVIWVICYFFQPSFWNSSIYASWVGVEEELTRCRDVSNCKPNQFVNEEEMKYF